MSKELVDRIIETDVLVIGGGIAGPRAAVEAKRRGARVFMVVKGIYGSGGCSLSPSTANSTGPWTDFEKDSVDRQFRDIVIDSRQFMCDQELAKIQAQEGGERLIELEKWGMVWDRDAQGRISVFPSGKLFPGMAVVDRWITFSRNGTHAVGPFWTGHGTVDILRDQINREEIPFIDETIVSDVFVTDNVVTGALAYDYFNCRTLLIKCSAIVIASGDYAQVYYPHTMICGEGSGDGFALAYEAGAQLVNMEMFEYIHLHFAYPDSARGKAVLETPSESGEMAYIRNSVGDRFMERYNPKTKELSSFADVALAIVQEAKEGRGGPHGGAFLDFRHIRPSVVKRSVPGRLEVIEKLGFDIRKDLIEVFPTVHTTSGGIRINPECHTRVRGLFAAGQVAFAIGDSMIEGATGIVDALIWGKRAGEFATAYSRSNNRLEPNLADVQEKVRLMKVPLESKSGIPPIKIMRRLQRAMWDGAGIVKSEQSLQKALEVLDDIRKSMVDQMSTKTKTGIFNHEMREAIEVRHMLTTSEAIARSSLTRKESRNRFHRSDYPRQDDEHWLRFVIAEKTREGMKITTEPIEFPYIKPGVSP